MRITVTRKGPIRRAGKDVDEFTATCEGTSVKGTNRAGVIHQLIKVLEAADIIPIGKVLEVVDG